jgi:hypothetical protein
MRRREEGGGRRKEEGGGRRKEEGGGRREEGGGRREEEGGGRRRRRRREEGGGRREEEGATRLVASLVHRVAVKFACIQPVCSPVDMPVLLGVSYPISPLSISSADRRGCRTGMVRGAASDRRE